MASLRGFSPVGAAAPRILILGSFPSLRSLEFGEYYGHPRNQFWFLLGSHLGFDPASPYAHRVECLARAGIALWDVIASCDREGSLDRDIRGESPNDLVGFLDGRPSIERVALNGGKAAASFMMHFASELGHWPRGAASPAAPGIGVPLEWRPDFAPGRLVEVARLPSSSPVPTRDYRVALDKLPAWSRFLA
jgi:TDG/mug DNA glycosylase family protein